MGAGYSPLDLREALRGLAFSESVIYPFPTFAFSALSSVLYLQRRKTELVYLSFRIRQ